ncbi:hypothetical protein SAMN02746065_113117 [Desulfocicer vacuolatum DSM 3385]|uniref:Uncharacterized protein n=1 Tax=Desulfocicer vacuolatum DSM 3385 TaxID=1121400 RepID=A0A1W2CU62_9BACT|nr:hypothetical protein SAMN02746065_113117 [Desulfocicer vacuolatum DSM 3385]
MNKSKKLNHTSFMIASTICHAALISTEFEFFC